MYTLIIALIGAVTGILGCVLSIILFRRSVYKLKLSMISANLSGGHELLICDFLISNGSSLPISISNIAIKGRDGSLLYFSTQEKIIFQTHAGEELKLEIRSNCPPIALNPYQSFKGFFTIFKKDISSEAFPGLLDSTSSPAKEWTIVLETTRRTSKYKVTAPKANDYYTPFAKTRDRVI
ncbi:MAG: hypothetical protein JXN65_09185 [Clostridia bacterium]|nr:hypothetical protein [Clostridia bacterium]